MAHQTLENMQYAPARRCCHEDVNVDDQHSSQCTPFGAFTERLTVFSGRWLNFENAKRNRSQRAANVSSPPYSRRVEPKHLHFSEGITMMKHTIHHLYCIDALQHPATLVL